MVYVFLADGFEEVEAMVPVDFLRRCGITVHTVGMANLQVMGAHGMAMQADMLFADYQLGTQDVLILPGGMPGSTNLRENAVLCDMVCKAHARQQLIASICAAPAVILHDLGLLTGKKATCHPVRESSMTQAILTDAQCVTDGNIITARGAGASFDFAIALATALCGQERALQVADQMCYPRCSAL